MVFHVVLISESRTTAIINLFLQSENTYACISKGEENLVASTREELVCAGASRHFKLFSNLKIAPKK